MVWFVNILEVTLLFLLILLIVINLDIKHLKQLNDNEMKEGKI